MPLNFRNSALTISLLLWLAVPLELSAQQTVRYKLIDLGTLGGPISYGSVNGYGFRLLNDSGTVASYADLAVPGQAHAFQWKNGVITDLGTLSENNNSAAGSLNSRGWATGQSQNSTIDPVLGFPEFRGVLWKNGQIIDLGTLDSGTESLGIFVNDAGQVIGFSTINSEPDPIGFFFQTHTFIWEDGKKLDIGTLGGSDALPGASCSNPPKGMVWGQSSTSTTPNPDTGLPTVDPFLWDHGKMTDLGTLGGTFGFAQCANHRGQVIGDSSVGTEPAACTAIGSPGCHAFFWENGTITDLGTLGGDSSQAWWLNDAGVIAGSADLSTPGIHHAVRWKDGQILDLGTVEGDACSHGRAINAKGQIVGGSTDCHNSLHAFIWEEGGPMLDLNTLIPPGSGVQLTNAININDRGEILAQSDPLGVTPIGEEDLGHLVLLVPCEEDRGDCGNVSSLTSGWNQALSSFAPNLKEPPRTIPQLMREWRQRFSEQHRLPIGSQDR